MSPFAVLFCIGSLLSPHFVSALDFTCPNQEELFLSSLDSKCPSSIYHYSPVEVDGSSVDKVLSSKQRNAYTSVLFYASWCPFSQDMRPSFEQLSSMFPQIEHLTVEQSSALPSVFSRYGVHSFPAILLINETSRVRYRGLKNLQALVHYYEKTTGLEPVQHLTEDKPPNFVHGRTSMSQWDGSSIEDIMKKEPYIMLATLFLILRLLVFASPRVLSSLKAFFSSYIPHFNLGIFGETSQLFARVLHVIDVRRIWTKLKLCKNRNFQERAKNCRVWASSLASVSLGESSPQARS